MSKIFLSYRRSDGQDVAGRIYDSLVDQYTKECVFKDVDSIPLGKDFRRILEKSIENADVILAVIGPGWLSATDAGGARRLDDADDFVRIELEMAIRLGKPIIPVTVANAKMIAATELPTSLQDLAFHNGMAVRPDPDFHNDIVRLISALEKLSPGLARHPRKPAAKEPRTNSLLVSICVAFGLFLLAAIAVGAFILADDFQAHITPTNLPGDGQGPKRKADDVTLKSSAVFKKGDEADKDANAKKPDGLSDLKKLSDGPTITTDEDGKTITTILPGKKRAPQKD